MFRIRNLWCHKGLVLETSSFFLAQNYCLLAKGINPVEKDTQAEWILGKDSK
jgi:hypothetical protein